ncbi:N-acetylmuramoyl-L-alanine amidase [Flagellimonas pacifica]|nr:N-acetylmuramoyl-L-alanine amidase [Allomuricauda parva]
MKLLPTFLLWVSMPCLLLAQNDYYTVVAQKGDGIFSILRKQGLDPVKYYEDFLTLNTEDIKDGSMLHVGREYKIPQAMDSFKKTGVRVQMKDETENPIFDKELAEMSLKSKALKNAVYYIVAENQAKSQNKFIDDVTTGLAAELMVHGATVYVFDDTDEKPSTENMKSEKTERMGQYIEAINKRYLQNTGKYQRLLLIRANGLIENGNMDVAVYHHNKSEKGQRFAENIQNVFKKHSVSNRSYKDIKMIFEDKNSLYLAKNTLPTVSLLTIGNRSKASAEDHIPVRSDKKAFTNWITNGILKDYADITIEE